MLGRADERRCRARLLAAHGYDVALRRGRRPARTCTRTSRDARRLFRPDRGHPGPGARAWRRSRGLAWPAIVLRTPKGWTGPKFVDGQPVEGTFRAHQVPISTASGPTRNISRSSRTGCAATDPRSSSTPMDASVDDLAQLAPIGERRMGANPHANGGRLLRPLVLPEFTDYAMPVTRHGAELPRIDCASSGKMLRDVYRATTRPRTSASSAPTRRTPTGSARSSRSRTAASWKPTIPIDDHVAADGRVMEVLSEHLCQGWLEGYLLTGRHGLFATYEAFAMVVGVDDGPAHQVARRRSGPLLARTGRVAERAADLHLLAQRSQRLQPPGAGPHRHRDHEEGQRRPHLPATRRQLPALGRRSLPARAATT